MNGIMELLVNLLCPGGAAYECEKFLYPYEGNTVLQLLWFAFFPIIFIILLTYLLANGVVQSTGVKIKTLIGIAIIMLVIIQGWYPYVLWASKVWWLSVVILGSLYMFTHKMGVKGGGGGGGTAGESKAGWMRTALLGTQPLDPRIMAANRKLCEMRGKVLAAQMKDLEMERGKSGSDREKAEYAGQLADLHLKMRELELRKKRGLSPD